MTRYVLVKLTVPQAKALNQAVAEVEAAPEETWTTARWGALGRARGKLLAALDRATGGKWTEED